MRVRKLRRLRKTKAKRFMRLMRLLADSRVRCSPGRDARRCSLATRPGWPSSHRAASLAVLSGKHRSAYHPRPTATGRWRRNRVSSNPKASAAPTRARSDSNKASPHRFISLDAVCQFATQLLRHRPPPVAHRAARVVNQARTGATQGGPLSEQTNPAPRIRAPPSAFPPHQPHPPPTLAPPAQPLTVLGQDVGDGLVVA